MHGVDSFAQKSAIPVRTAPKPPTNLCALTQHSYQHRYVQEVNQGPMELSEILDDCSRFVIEVQVNAGKRSLTMPNEINWMAALSAESVCLHLLGFGTVDGSLMAVQNRESLA